MPPLALAPSLRAAGWELVYLGSHGIEKDLLSQGDIPFRCIQAGKWRRYASWRNMTDLFRLLWGCLQALYWLRREEVFAVFSKGGYVSIPVLVAAKILGKPVDYFQRDHMFEPFARPI